MAESDVSLDGRSAVVTGAGAGLGRAEALRLAEMGASVVVNDLGDSADDVVAEITGAGGAAVAHHGSVSDFDGAKAMVDLAIETFGDLDIVVNNAGVLRDRTVFNMSEEEWDIVIDVHLKGHFCVTKWATAHWREQAKSSSEPTYGRLIGTSSEAWLGASPGQPNYSAAKAGIVALTFSAAQACRKYGVTANVICPRARTAMTDDQPWVHTQDDSFDRFSPEHVASLVGFLASPAAERITGEVFVVWGGLVQIVGGPRVEERLERDDAWTPELLAAELGGHYADREGLGFLQPARSGMMG